MNCVPKIIPKYYYKLEKYHIELEKLRNRWGILWVYDHEPEIKRYMQNI